MVLPVPGGPQMMTDERRSDSIPVPERWTEEVLTADDLVPRVPSRNRHCKRRPALHRSSTAEANRSGLTHPGYAPRNSSQQLGAKRVPRTGFSPATLVRRSRRSLDDLAIGRFAREEQRQPSRGSQCSESSAVSNDLRSPRMEGATRSLGEHHTIRPAEIRSERLGSDAHSVLLHRHRQPGATHHVEHVQLRPAAARIETDPACRKESTHDRHMTSGSGLEPLGAQTQPTQRSDSAAQQTSSRNNQLVFAQQDRTVSKRTLEGGACDAPTTTHIGFVERPGSLHTDLRITGRPFAFDRHLVMILIAARTTTGARLMNGRRRIRRLTIRRPVNLASRIRWLYESEDPRPMSSENSSTKQAPGLVLAQLAVSKLVEGDQTLLRREYEFESSKTSVHVPDRCGQHGTSVRWEKFGYHRPLFLPNCWERGSS